MEPEVTLTWRRAAHLALVLIGLGVAIWGAATMWNPRVMCFGVEMHPGDVCKTSTFSQVGAGKVQTYEQRVHGSRLSQPLVIGTGVLMVGFGGLLLRQDLRKQKKADAG